MGTNPRHLNGHSMMKIPDAAQSEREIPSRRASRLEAMEKVRSPSPMVRSRTRRKSLEDGPSGR
jgi:hypothetical protein